MKVVRVGMVTEEQIRRLCVDGSYQENCGVQKRPDGLDPEEFRAYLSSNIDSNYSIVPA